jgi:hypothetical protein
VDFRPLDVEERQRLREALRKSDDAALIMGRDTSFAGTGVLSAEITDDEVIDAIKSVPSHYALTNVSSGATKVTKKLNAANQESTIWVAGQSKVGINIFSVTGTPTFTFLGSTDGVQYNPVSVAPYPAAQAAGYQIGGVATQANLPAGAIQTASAAGQWEVNVGNLQFFRVQMTAGAGPASLIMAASVDGSYQEAFQTPTNIGVTQSIVYPSTTSTASDLNTMTIPAVTNATINLTFLEVSMTGGGPGGNAQLRIWDNAVGNGVPLYSCFLTPPTGSVGTVQKINLPTDAQNNIGVQGTPGNALVVQIRNLGNTSSIINARVSYL